MKKLHCGWMLTTAASATLMAAMALPVSAAGAMGAPAPMGAPVSGAAMQEHNWDAPPEELDEVSRHGFHDGIEGARADFDNHRRPDVNNRDEFRHPRVPHRDREAYRRGFERGYRVGVEHLYHEQR